MSKDRMYLPLSTVAVSSPLLENFAGQQVFLIDKLPKAIVQRHELLLAVGPHQALNNPPRLRRIEAMHMRAHLVETTQSEPICDQYGNAFSPRITQKGADFTEPKLFASQISSWGYDIHGLQVGGALGRALRTSELMRQEGIDCEMIIGIQKLQHFYLKGQLVDLQSFRDHLLTTVDVEDSAREQIRQELAKRPLYVTYRLMSTPERLLDLLSPRTLKDRDTLYQNIQADLEIQQSCQANRFPDYQRQIFDPNSFKDQKRFLTHYVARNLGRNVAAMHATGLYHRYLHLQNINALGGIVDLDSVRGTPTGFPTDLPITTADITRDLDRVTSDLFEIAFDDDPYKLKFKHLGREEAAVFVSQMMQSYFTEILKREAFNYKFIEPFRVYQHFLVQTGRTDHFDLFDRLEAKIDELYSAILPTQPDLIGHEQININSEQPSLSPSLISNLLREDARSIILQKVIAQGLVDVLGLSAESLLHQFIEPLIGETYLRHHRTVSRYSLQYFCQFIQRALTSTELSAFTLPYIYQLNDRIPKLQQLVPGLKELLDQYSIFIPSKAEQEALWRHLQDQELVFYQNLSSPFSAEQFATHQNGILLRMERVVTAWVEDKYQNLQHTKLAEDHRAELYIPLVTNFMGVLLEKKVHLLKEYSEQVALAEGKVIL